MKNINLVLNSEKPKSFCGVFGAFGEPHSAVDTYYGLHALQHRGQESAGIVTARKDDSGKTHFSFHKDFGLVSDVFHESLIFEEKLTGTASIGHNRYSTTGSSVSKKNIQPFVVNYRMGHLALAHNGNITNAGKIRDELVNDGAIFQTSSDSEVVLHLIARSKEDDQVEQIRDALRRLKGAYSLTILTDDKLIAARDPLGFKPLSIGKLNGGFLVASETCAFDINHAEYLRDVEPGEIVVIDNESIETNKLKSYKIFPEHAFTPKHCIFEFIYFSRPDSKIFGTSVDKIRRKLGKMLAKNHPVKDPDGEKVIVISVPDSSNTTALGYENHLEKMGIKAKLEIGLIRSHYIGRTFIQPQQSKREVGVRIKFNTVDGVLEGKTVVLIDDSIVRGTTSKQLVKLIREANPKSIHLRISSAPIYHPCYYGMDFPSKDELIANKFSDIESIREYLGVDTLEYMTIDEMLESMSNHAPDDFCTACFSGKYPTKINDTYVKEYFDDE